MRIVQIINARLMEPQEKIMMVLIVIIIVVETLRMLPFINIDMAFRLDMKIKELKKWLRDQER